MYFSMESQSQKLMEAESFFEESMDETENIQPQSKEWIYVYVCGCVYVPGVYTLEEGARVMDAVEAAGGMTDKADPVGVNLAVVLKDEMRVYIPSLEVLTDEQIPVLTDGSGVDNSLSKQVNINTATEEQLTALSGIGASRAADIIEYRNTYGNFDSIEDLKKVSGIKEGVFEKIKDQITVN